MTSLGALKMIVSLCVIGTCTRMLNAQITPELKIMLPQVREQAVVIPAAFWNENVCDWLEVAISGRPSEFLHETLIALPSPQADIIRAMHTIGFRDAPKLAPNFSVFQQIRGDRVLLLAQVARNGNQETYLLEELMEFRGWGISVGPLGWLFKGAAPGADSQPAAIMGDDGKPLSDAQKILADDPQAALTFKGLQHMSHSFIDFPLTYDDWLWPPLTYRRNTALLSAEVFNSNGNVPVTLIIKKVSETQALEAVIQYWHDQGAKELARKLMPIARAIDEQKQKWTDAPENGQKMSHLDIAKIQAAYQRLDAAWVEYSFAHAKFSGEPDDIAAMRKQGARFVDHLKALAEISSIRQQKAMAASPLTLYGLTGRELLVAMREQEDYWREQQAGLDPKDDPRKDWATLIKLQLEFIDAAKKYGNAGIAASESMIKNGSAEEPRDYKLTQKLYSASALRVQIQKAKMEIARLEQFPGDDTKQKIDQLHQQVDIFNEYLKKAEDEAKTLSAQ